MLYFSHLQYILVTLHYNTVHTKYVLVCEKKKYVFGGGRASVKEGEVMILLRNNMSGGGDGATIADPIMISRNTQGNIGTAFQGIFTPQFIKKLFLHKNVL